MLKKNAAQRWWVRCIDGDTGYIASGQAASITATICKDSDIFTATTDVNPTEVDASGYYYFNLTANETNADTVDIVAVHSSNKYRIEPLHGERFTSQLISDAVWDELTSSHITAATFGEKVFSISGVTGLVATRTVGTTLKAFVGETYTHTITTVDADGNAVDCSGLTLEVIIEKLDRTDVVTIADGNISKTTTTVSFAVSNTYHTTEANYRWALRRTDTGVVIMQGPYVVHYAADN